MKDIIFDIGNVLLSFQPEEFLKQHYNDEQIGDLMTIIFCSDEWDQLDLGTITIQETIDSLTLKNSHYHD
ncbi:MAG: HAD family phosphatase, partial [Coprobacillus sp.]